MNFSAVILAGGKSSRMGRDKAWLEIDGRPLIARQVELLRKLQPVEILISIPPTDDLTEFDCRVLLDNFAGQGPLAGIEAALAVTQSPWLLTLAVDMPRMTPETLRWLLAGVSELQGVVPRKGDWVEPLAAIYPRPAHSLLCDSLRKGRNAARRFAAQCAEAGLVRWLDIPSERLGDFTNCNSPAEWAAELEA